MKVWLQNESTDWRYSANLVPNIDIAEDLGTSSLRWGNIFASTATLDGGLVLNTLARIRTNQTTAEIFTSTVTTLNIGSAATAVNVGAATGTLTVGNPTVTMTNGTTLNMNGASPSIVTSNAGTASVFNTNALTGNLFGAATTANLASAGTTVRIGATSGTLTIGNPTVVGTEVTQNLYNTVATTVNAFGAATTANVGSAATTMRIGGASGTLTIGNTTVVGTGATQALYNTVATSLSIGGDATTLNLGNATAATVTLRPGTLVGSNTTQNVYNTVATTVNAFGAATTLNIGNAGGANLIRGTTTLNVLAADGDGSQVTGNWTLSGGATFQATYADLAEWYGADAEYEPGTVLIFGGDSEVTTTTLSNDSRVAGVVTTDPAYIMNVGQEGTRACIALQGRVPVKVVGIVRKGDMLTTSNTVGYATKAMNPTVGTIIGKALEDKDDPGTGTIQVAIGRM